ncbi:MAG: DUF4412 domain-containing protein [Verrucomicrobia bacterium]|nr:DUF4412 domain-containing protein [Verrucomicrobiota bacterium]
MKASTRIICLLCTQAFLSLAQADIVLVQHTFAGAVKTPSITTMSIKGDQVRSDNGTETSVIMNTATGDMTTLMHEQKMVIKVNTKALGTAAPTDTLALDKSLLPKITATGKKETIDGYECEIYTSEAYGTVMKMWICNNYPGYKKLKAELQTLTKLADANAPNGPEVPGMMVKSEIEHSGVKFVTKLVSLKEKPLSEDLFVIPSDYKEPGA